MAHKHQWVLGPGYCRCLDCQTMIANPSDETLLDIGAVRVEDGIVHFTVDPQAEKDLTVPIETK